MRFRIRTLLILIVAAALVAYLVSSLLRTREAIHDAYAVWWVADMVVEHLKANEDQWPSSWDDLLDDYQTCVTRAGAQPWRFEDLKQRVEIDWNADPEDLVGRDFQGNSDVRFIWRKSGSQASWSDAEPNQIVLDYLKGRPMRNK